MNGRSGVTLEGTRWRTRPWSDEITARYTCTRQGGLLPCTHADADFLCEKHQGGKARCYGDLSVTHHVYPRATCQSMLGYKGKPYSSATPKGAAVPSALPASVGADFVAACAVAVRRLRGDEPWPPDPWKTPTLRTVARWLVDPAFTRLYREFCEAVVRAGGALAMPLGTRRRSPVVRRKETVARHWTDGLSEYLKERVPAHLRKGAVTHA